jgi:hypothetical protein
VHDLDRIRLEAMDHEFVEEAELDDLATQLLEIADDQELDEFLGRVIAGATDAARRFARSDTGQALKGIAKDAARRALPVIGRGIGGLVSPAGARGGETIGRGIGQVFGLELEGLSLQDQQFEAARSYLRWLRTATRTADRYGSSMSPRAAARRAAIGAARRHAPGLVPLVERAGGQLRQGRWERRGDAILLFNV